MEFSLSLILCFMIEYFVFWRSLGNYIHISKMEKEVFAITKFILLSLKGNQADVTIWEGSLAGQRMPEWATSNWVCLQLVEIANLIT